MKQRTASAISRARALWVASLLTVAASATAQASVIDYKIENKGGLWDSFDSAKLWVDGTFTFDTATSAISNFNVTFWGDIWLYGTYTDRDNPWFGSSDDPHQPMIGFTHQGNVLTMFIGLILSGPLDQYARAIVGGYWFITPDDIHKLVPDDPQNRPWVFPVRESPTPAPEPSTWAMVLGAFAGAAAWVRRRKVHLYD